MKYTNNLELRAERLKDKLSGDDLNNLLGLIKRRQRQIEHSLNDINLYLDEINKRRLN